MNIGSPKKMDLVPPRQTPYTLALEMAFDALSAKPPSAEKLLALGARIESGCIGLTVLYHDLLVDIDRREVVSAGGGRVRSVWALLVLHYLNTDDVSSDSREVSLVHFSDCRGYLAVFNKRILGRFLKTAGKTAEQFEKLGKQFHGTLVESSGLSYRFHVLPRVPITIIRHEADVDFGPGANIIYRADIEHLLPVEDRIVAAELLLDTLSGAPIDEVPKGSL